MSSEGLCLALSSSPSHNVGVRVVVLVVDAGWKWSTKVEAFETSCKRMTNLQIPVKVSTN